MDKNIRKKPNFIGIGGQRCGTSWVYACLFEHPQILAKEKEIHFFSREQKFQKGQDWYEDFFYGEEDKIRGEISTSYISDDKVPERIEKYYPHVKLFAILRDPIERAISNYFNDLTSGLVDSNISFKEALKVHPEYLEQGLYFKYLNNFDFFNQKNHLKLFCYEKSLFNPKEYISSIYNYIGVDSNFTPSYLHKKVNISRVPKSVFVDRFLVKGAEIIRNLGLNNLWWLIKKSGIPQFILKNNTNSTKEDIKEVVSKEDRDFLISFFKEDVINLNKKYNFDISLWKDFISFIDK